MSRRVGSVGRFGAEGLSGTGAGHGWGERLCRLCETFSAAGKAWTSWWVFQPGIELHWLDGGGHKGHVAEPPDKHKDGSSERVPEDNPLTAGRSLVDVITLIGH